MAGTFYGIAQLNMKSQMRERGDGSYPARVAQELVHLNPPIAPDPDAADSRGGLLARAWRLLTRPAARRAEGCSTC
jgi:hypothetical protein